MEAAVPQLIVRDRAVATSVRLQALLRTSRTPARPVPPGRGARAGNPSPADQAAAAALYEQLAFGDDADVQEDQDDEQDQEFVISPERREWLQELQHRVGELARDVPKAKKGRGGSPAASPRRPGYRPRC